MKRHWQILVLCILFGLGFAVIIAGGITYMNAGAPVPTRGSEHTQRSPAEQASMSKTQPGGSTNYHLVVSTADASTGKPLGGVLVYLDGRYEGSTTETGTTGNLIMSPLLEGQHTIRVTKPGYLEQTRTIIIPVTSVVEFGLQGQLLVPIHESGSSATSIDIVFVPSATSYNCAERRQISPTLYVNDRDAFVTDVNRIVNNALFNLESITDKTEPIPADYRDRFNIYYYYDPAQFADAFNGCAGTVPDTVWDAAPFADLVIILYPTYYTPNIGVPCEPNGCVYPGTGRSWMKIPADQNTLFLHECGHAIFGLIDTYCGGTEYWQNEPYPNVWSALASCRSEADANSWDPAACRQIRDAGPAACSKQFWRWDPDPDIMHNGYSGMFGMASTRRISYTLTSINTGGKTP